MQSCETGVSSPKMAMTSRGCAPYYMDISKINFGRKSSSAEVDIETVEFANKSRKIYCYDKGCEAKNLFKKNKINAKAVEAAHGILRLEVRFNTTEAVKRLSYGQLNLPDIQAQTLLNFDVAKSVLTSAIESLGLHETGDPI